MGARLVFDPIRLAADSAAIGPGTPGALREIIYLLVASCMDPSCSHCLALSGMLAQYDGERLAQAGRGHCPCLLHGIQLDGHTCDWTQLLADQNAAFEQAMQQSTDQPPTGPSPE